jgi:hypothetical protein
MNISKELLCEISDIEKSTIQKIHFEDNQIVVNCSRFDSTGVTGNHWTRRINIYELQHKIKEWAFKNGYNVLSGYDQDDNIWALINHIYGEGGCQAQEEFNAPTEFEAVVKAADYILEKLQEK